VVVLVEAGGGVCFFLAMEITCEILLVKEPVDEYISEDWLEEETGAGALVETDAGFWTRTADGNGRVPT